MEKPQATKTEQTERQKRNTEIFQDKHERKQDRTNDRKTDRTCGRKKERTTHRKT